MMDGNAASKERTAGATWQRAAASLDFPGGGDALVAAAIGFSVTASRTEPENGSTRRRWAARKSIPRMGFDTAARINVQRNVRKPKLNFFVTVPQEAIERPSAPVSGIPEEGAVDRCGRTLTAAPVSTRNFCSVVESRR
jgi:hypothetical protein